jgi:hypothetical protein
MISTLYGSRKVPEMILNNAGRLSTGRDQAVAGAVPGQQTPE